jgi:hypothetical protein
VNLDWGAFAGAWRTLYRPTLDRVRSGELPWHSRKAELVNAPVRLAPGLPPHVPFGCTPTPLIAKQQAATSQVPLTFVCQS